MHSQMAEATDELGLVLHVRCDLNPAHLVHELVHPGKLAQGGCHGARRGFNLVGLEGSDLGFTWPDANNG